MAHHAAAQPISALDRLSWLAGHWVGDAGSETWVAAGPAMFGIGFAGDRSATSFFEVMILHEPAGALTFTALPGGRGGIDFAAVELGQHTFLVANPAHDHPQRIRYTRNHDRLHARIESQAQGGEEWTWRRAVLAPAPALEEVERRLAADVASRGAAAWADVFAPDGALWCRTGGRTGARIDGAVAIRAAAARALASSGAAQDHLLEWSPLASGMALAGDLGFTVASYRLVSRDQDHAAGAPPRVVQTGSYATIWRRQADGTWRAVFQTGSPACMQAI